MPLERFLHADLDEDGYGDPEVVIYACEESDNISANSSDCDDSNSDINPHLQNSATI